MSLLNARTMRLLAGSRLLTQGRIAAVGVGDRPSSHKGPGLEFEDHRDYQIGDDIRHLDRHVRARLGIDVVRQFNVSRGLQVTLLVDGSESMAFGNPVKSRRAVELAAAIGYVGLAAGDHVLTGRFAGGMVDWFRNLHGETRAAAMMRWLEGVEFRGSTDFLQGARASLRRLPSAGMLVLISDLMGHGVEEALGLWRAAGQEVLVVHLLAPEDLDAELLGRGALTLADAETGGTVDVTLDGRAIERYRRAVAEWKQGLRGRTHAVGGRYIEGRSDDDLERTLLYEWRSRGIIS